MLFLAALLTLKVWSQDTESKKVVTAYEGYAGKGLKGWIGYAK